MRSRTARGGAAQRAQNAPSGAKNAGQKKFCPAFFVLPGFAGRAAPRALYGIVFLQFDTVSDELFLDFFDVHIPFRDTVADGDCGGGSAALSDARANGHDPEI